MRGSTRRWGRRGTRWQGSDVATVNIAYGSETAITWTAAIGASTTVARECTAIDNTSTKADDYAVNISIVYPNAAVGGDGNVYIYAGAWYGANIGWEGSPALTGSDASYTFDAAYTTSPPALRLARACFQVQAKTRVFAIPSIATVFGGVVPDKFGLVLANNSGQTLTTVTAYYQAITFTVV